jgi:Flp pilus assembly protein TadG
MSYWRSLAADESGAMAIETAIVAPVLALLSIGGFQASEVVATQHLLLSTASEAEQIALATKPETTADLTTIKSVLMTTSGLPTEAVAVDFKYRCGTDPVMVDSAASCGVEAAWTFVRISLEDTYSPMWVQLGIGEDVEMSVVRNVQIS